MKKFYRVNVDTNKIVELEPDDLIDSICYMRTEAEKDGKFFYLVQDYLINKFWDWQCEHASEVDPNFQIFDRIEDAQEKQKENRLTDKLNEEIKKEINKPERERLQAMHEFVESIRNLEVEEDKPTMSGLDHLLSPESTEDRLERAQEFLKNKKEELDKAEKELFNNAIKLRFEE
jgi:hypothetical protein